jgi:hypothetical protein
MYFSMVQVRERELETETDREGEEEGERGGEREEFGRHVSIIVDLYIPTSKLTALERAHLGVCLCVCVCVCVCVCSSGGYIQNFYHLGSDIIGSCVRLVHSDCPIKRLSAIGALRAASRHTPLVPFICAKEALGGEYIPHCTILVMTGANTNTCRHDKTNTSPPRALAPASPQAHSLSLTGRNGIMAALRAQLPPKSTATVFGLWALEFLANLAINSPAETPVASHAVGAAGVGGGGNGAGGSRRAKEDLGTSKQRGRPKRGYDRDGEFHQVWTAFVTKFGRGAREDCDLVGQGGARGGEGGGEGGGEEGGRGGVDAKRGGAGMDDQWFLPVLNGGVDILSACLSCKPEAHSPRAGGR